MQTLILVALGAIFLVLAVIALAVWCVVTEDRREEVTGEFVEENEPYCDDDPQQWMRVYRVALALILALICWAIIYSFGRGVTGL